MSKLSSLPLSSQEPLSRYTSAELELLSAVASARIKELEYLVGKLEPSYHTYTKSKAELEAWRTLAAKFSAK